jgi:ABC-type transport system substrate-binding protein
MRRGLLLAIVGAVLIACGPMAPAPAEPSGGGPLAASPGSPSSPAATPGARLRPLVIATDSPITTLSKVSPDRYVAHALRFVYSSLYRLGPELVPVPDLAAAPCETADAQAWTCRLRSATFHDGTPLTARDVAFTYELASVECAGGEVCLGEVLSAVRAVDERNVRFELRVPYAPFATRFLPAIGIESRAAVESAFEEISAGVAGVGLGEIRRVMDAISVEANRSGAADCARPAEQAAAILEQVGVEVPAHEPSELPCAIAADLGALLGQLVASQQGEGMTALRAAYPLLPLNRQPIGSGPYRCEPGCVRDDGSVRLAPFDAYHGGRPAASAVVLQYSAGYPPGRLVADGEVDWARYVPPDDPTLETDHQDLKLAEYVDLGYFALQYNVRDGALFADPNLRQAMRLCLDKERSVADATLGNGVPVETAIPPASWAHHPDLPHVERDVDAARRLIESSGWRLGDDGVYVDGEGRRLATEVWVRERPDRAAFAESLAEQVADCGMEIEPVADDHILALGTGGLLHYPHIPPVGVRPWDLYLGGWSHDADPDLYPFFHSSQCTTEEEPNTYNYICYQNPRLDRLLEAGRATPDIAERRELYLEVQEILADEQPYLFLWADVRREAVDANLRSTRGELDLNSPMWGWQPETLFVDE